MKTLWDQRASARGHLGVVPATWNQDRYDRETADWWARLSGFLLPAGNGRILDYGCGTGRFTRLLNEHFDAHGVDQSPEMLRRATGASFAQLEDGRIPAPDDYFDVLWTCTVLQHVPDAELPAVAEEIRRVLRPGALVLLCENTHGHSFRVSGSGHMIFRNPGEYASLFPGIVVVDEFIAESERHTVLRGYLEKAP